MRVFHHPDHRLHDPQEPHVFGGRALPPAEVAARADRLLQGLATLELEVVAPSLVDGAVLERVHERRYLAFLATAHDRWREATGGPSTGEAVPYIRPLPGTPWREPEEVLPQLGRFSNDVDPLLAGTWSAALASASCAAGAAEDVMGGARSAYGLTRPPGHHAGPETFGGYCYLNNGAVAAVTLLREAARVAVLDVDTHHGNGTQAIFWEEPRVLTVSIHGDPRYHYPYFLGFRGESGGRGAPGGNANYPLPTGTTWDGYEEALQSALGMIGSFGAEALIVALGVDTHRDHGVLSLEGDDFSRMGEAVASVGLPTVFVQEGGYALDTLERCVPAVLSGFGLG